jgi:hypothetical protein
VKEALINSILTQSKLRPFRKPREHFQFLRCYTRGLLPQLSRAGEWFLHSGIQEPNGGVARYYRIDLGRNAAVSTEITGYAVSALVYLHALTQQECYLDRAAAGARFLVRSAWDGELGVMPFELDPPAFSYFFDCGIVVRGLLSAWRATGSEEFLEGASAVGRSMARDFLSPGGDFHPILALPGKEAEARDPSRWSRSPGCYQLKAAMAWHDLAEAAGAPDFRELYQRFVDDSLRHYGSFLPGHPNREKVMDRLHAFLYFLEGLLPCAADPRAAAAVCDGIGRASGHLRDIAPEFVRSDVYAQLLRIRLHAAAAGAVPLDRAAAQEEAAALETFQAENGGFYFGRKGAVALPYESPVSTAFALEALSLWHGCASPHRHLLI